MTTPSYEIPKESLDRRSHLIWAYRKLVDSDRVVIVDASGEVTLFPYAMPVKAARDIVDGHNAAIEELQREMLA